MSRSMSKPMNLIWNWDLSFNILGNLQWLLGENPKTQNPLSKWFKEQVWNCIITNSVLEPLNERAIMFILQPLLLISFWRICDHQNLLMLPQMQWTKVNKDPTINAIELEQKKSKWYVLNEFFDLYCVLQHIQMYFIQILQPNSLDISWTYSMTKSYIFDLIVPIFWNSNSRHIF